MRLLLLPACLLLLDCSGAMAEGDWRVTEVMSHRCRSAAALGLSCEDSAALAASQRVGRMRIDALDNQRLRLVDVDGRVCIGQSYSDGARFRWASRLESESGSCVESFEEIVELREDADGLSGQRRIYASQSEGCGTANVTDEGYTLSAKAFTELP